MWRRRICFRPIQFIISKTIRKGSDKAIFHFCIQSKKGTDDYVLNYYDAVLQKEVALEKEVNGIDIAILEKRMRGIDWRSVFHLGDTDVIPIEEKKLWEEARVIESIICDLARLDEGKDSELALHLKQKFWAGTNYQTFTGTLFANKLKDELCQRFFLQDENIISSDEAFRFLQNRWLERELKARQRSEKHVERNSPSGTDNYGHDAHTHKKRKKPRPISNSGDKSI